MIILLRTFTICKIETNEDESLNVTGLNDFCVKFANTDIELGKYRVSCFKKAIVPRSNMNITCSAAQCASNVDNAAHEPVLPRWSAA